MRPPAARAPRLLGLALLLRCRGASAETAPFSAAGAVLRGLRGTEPLADGLQRQVAEASEASSPSAPKRAPAKPLADGSQRQVADASEASEASTPSAPKRAPAKPLADGLQRQVTEASEASAPSAPKRAPAKQLASNIPKDFERIEATFDTKASGERPAPYSSQKDLNGLFRHISGEYHDLRDLPPVPPDGGPLAVGVRVRLVKFQDLDEVAGTVNLVLDLTLCWSDDRVSFDSGDARDKLPITSKALWTPDIVVLNQVSQLDDMFAVDDTPLVLATDAFKQETGVNVLWTRRINMKSRCEIDMLNFPFDTQMCSIIIGSWASSRRQMLLVPQDSHQRFDPGASIHTSEFRVLNITVQKRDVYMRNAAERFEEIQYGLVLQRFPHFYIVNFILPMVAVTMLTVATMWMSNAGTRMNSGTRLLLCVVQIMNITATWRPANESDIWLDRFQTHCLALTMSAVLQSLVVDYLLKTGLFDLSWAPRSHVVDTVLRTAICLTTIFVFFADFCELVKQQDAQGLYGTFHAHSSKLLVGFVWLIFMCLGASSIFSTLWLVLPKETWKRMCCKGCAPVASGGGDRPWSMDDT